MLIPATHRDNSLIAFISNIAPLLTQAEAQLFRLRWSEQILDETGAAIVAMLKGRGAEDAAERAARTRKAMVEAFEPARVGDVARMIARYAIGRRDRLADPG